MNWNFLSVYDDSEYKIRRAQADWGDSHSAATSTEGPMGFQFLSKGSLRVLDRNGDFYRDYTAGEQLTAPTDAPPWAMEKVILLSKERTDYFCIQSAISPMDPVTGTFHSLTAGETWTASGNFLVTYGKLEHENEIVYGRQVRRDDTKTYSVLENSMVVVFE